MMASFCTGTAQFFARLNQNPRYTFWPIEVVTDETRLHAWPRMVSITQALAIDLTGQACCDPDRRDTVRWAREPAGIHAGRRAGACRKADPLPLRDR